MQSVCRLLAAFGLAAGLSACGPHPMMAPDLAPLPASAMRDLPPARSFTAAHPMPPQRSNTEIARDILDLTLRLENGAELPVFTRFREPVTIALAGPAAPVFSTELDRLVARIRSEAGIDLTRAADGAPAAIVVEPISRGALQREVPSAACFVVPRRITWTEFTRPGRISGLNWTELSERTAATIFIPADIAPQEIRDCLHEETAQALGPVNDLFRLEDSIFNDDNMHSVLTGFDMLVLRAIYDPAVQNGMTRSELAAVLPPVLNRINPAGQGYATRPYAPSPRSWLRAIDTALTSDRPVGTRRQASGRALSIAQEEGWTDTRLGLSWLTRGRLARGGDGAEALEAFLRAGQIYDQRPAMAIHSANVGIQVSAFALATGQMDTALHLADRHIPAARQAENAALLSDLLLVRAAALDAMGRSAEAAEARREGYGWGRYGLRSDSAVLRRAAEIEALVPRGQEGT